MFRYMQEIASSEDNSNYIFGYSLSTIYRNLISLLFDSPELKVFSPFCNWRKGDSTLLFCDKQIKCIGAGDEGALGLIQGLTISKSLCDEITLYPENVIDMIDTRHRRECSQLFASMNPKHPDHKVKKWIDRAESGDPLYYSLHFDIDHNIFLPSHYKENLRKNLSGLFYKRNYLGLWCGADGAIYDFFDRALHTTSDSPTAATYYIGGIDFGTSNCFAAGLFGVNINRQRGIRVWLEKEYYWDVSQTNRQKTNTEYRDDMIAFFDGAYPKTIYIDPAAASFKLEMSRAGFPVADGDNDVLAGIQTMASMMQRGVFSINRSCKSAISEIERYHWDERKSKELGKDVPVKKYDHLMDCCRYALHTHKFGLSGSSDSSGRMLGSQTSSFDF